MSTKWWCLKHTLAKRANGLCGPSRVLAGACPALLVADGGLPLHSTRPATRRWAVIFSWLQQLIQRDTGKNPADERRYLDE